MFENADWEMVRKILVADIGAIFLVASVLYIWYFVNIKMILHLENVDYWTMWWLTWGLPLPFWVVTLVPLAAISGYFIIKALRGY